MICLRRRATQTRSVGLVLYKEWLETACRRTNGLDFLQLQICLVMRHQCYAFACMCAILQWQFCREPLPVFSKAACIHQTRHQHAKTSHTSGDDKFWAAASASALSLYALFVFRSERTEIRGMRHFVKVAFCPGFTLPY